MRNLLNGPAGVEVTRLVLPAAVRREIEIEAGRAAPDECCGLLTGHLAGERAVVTARIVSPNRAADPRTGFEIDPALLLRSQRALRSTGRQVLGHYHSHPNGIAEPSDADRARAWVPGHVWLIVVPAGKRTGADFSSRLAVKERGEIILRPLEIVAG